MPYIQQEDRDKILSGEKYTTPGELNFCFTGVALEYLGDNPNYQKFNDVIGAIECCKMELYRRKIALYEDEKIQTNGDVY